MSSTYTVMAVRILLYYKKILYSVTLEMKNALPT